MTIFKKKTSAKKYTNATFFLRFYYPTLLLICLGLPSGYAQEVFYARSVIKKLASAAFKGRGYAENGDKKAAAFISNEFRKAGLIPLNVNADQSLSNQKVFNENYNLSVNIFPGKMKMKIDEKLFQTAADYLISASSPTIKGKFDIIYANHTTLTTKKSLDSLISAATNSFILVDERPEESESAEKVSILKSNIDRLSFDKNLNFKGLILFTRDKLTWTTSDTQFTRPVITLNKPGFAPVYAKTIELDVEAKFLPVYQTQNVAGVIKGTSLTDSMLVVTAHYDHLGMMGKKVYFPGANDNASGTAMLLTLA
jgi:aminopeptidase YwaD